MFYTYKPYYDGLLQRNCDLSAGVKAETVIYRASQKYGYALSNVT